MRDFLSRKSGIAFLAFCLVSGVSIVAVAQDVDREDAQIAESAIVSDPESDFAVEGDGLDAPVVLQTARFLGVTPGETTLEEVRDKLGDPLNERTVGSDVVLQYAVGPFPSVDITIRDDVAVSVVAELSEPRTANDLAKELGVDTFTAILVENNGEALGMAFPERGMLFSYAINAPRRIVDRIVLEPLSAEMFLLRADATPVDQYERKLNDLERVLDIEPNNAEALWQGAKLLDLTGKQNDALQLAKKAVQASRNTPEYKLTLAKFTARAGDHQGAVAAVKRLLEQRNMTSLDEAHGKVVLGDLLSSGLNRDFAAAIEQHLAAVKIATPIVSDSDIAVRHRAEIVLVDAYLGAANDIANGNWERKSEVVPKWLKSAEELAVGFVQNDGATAILPLVVWRRTLEAYAGMDGDVTDTESVVQAVQQTGDALIDESDDASYKQHVRWEMLRANFAALRVAQTRARWSEALTYAGEAVRLVEQLPKDRLANDEARYLVGRLYFYVGSIYAINYKDHSEAVRWFERAIPNFEGGLAKADLFDTGIHGERYVSMGVSYWEAELADEALKLTKRGRDLMERAIKAGLLNKQSLIVPYTNLAEMLRAGGQVDEAEAFSARLAQLEGDSSQR